MSSLRLDKCCKISCLISAVFIISMIYTNGFTDQCRVIREYKAQLPLALQKRYETITRERLAIYYYGYVLGFLLSLFVLGVLLQQKQKIPIWGMVCIVVSVSFMTNYFYYILSPKSDWMLNHIQNEEQSKAWLVIYRRMQLFYHTGLLLGILAVAFFVLAFRRCSV